MRLGKLFESKQLLRGLLSAVLLAGGLLLSLGSSFPHASERRAPRNFYYRACSQGYGRHCYELGRMWANGRGGPVDMSRAISYYERACAKRHPFSCYLAGQHLEEGTREKDKERGIKLLSRACRFNISQACFRVGNVYLAARSDSEKLRKARLAFTRGCELGIPVSCSNLGYTWEHGLGGPNDLRVARDWYNTACSRGAAIGCNNLGACFEHGRGGNRDLHQALELYKRACAKRYQKGCRAEAAVQRKINLAELLRQRRQVVSECLSSSPGEDALEHLASVDHCQRQFADLQVSKRHSQQLKTRLAEAVKRAVSTCVRLGHQRFRSSQYEAQIKAVALCISRLQSHSAAAKAVARLQKTAQAWTVRLAKACMKNPGRPRTSKSLERVIKEHYTCIRHLRTGSQHYKRTQQTISFLEKRKLALRKMLSDISRKESLRRLCRKGALAVYRAYGGGQGGLLTQLVRAYWGLSGLGAFFWLKVRYKQWCIPYFSQCMGNCGTNRSRWYGWCYQRSRTCIRKAHWCDRHMGQLIQKTYRKYCRGR
ncbi:MAG: tetratricopeptide repeat protein [Candidatus Zixiibacteriota bacterium]